MKRHQAGAFLARLVLAALAVSTPPAFGQQQNPTGQAQSVADKQAASNALARLGDDYLGESLRFQPIAATILGIPGFDAELGRSLDPNERQRHFSQLDALLKRLSAINREALSAAEQTSYDVLLYDLNTNLAMAKYPDHLMPITQMASFQVDFPAPVLANFASGKGAQPLATPEQYRAFLSRLTQLAGWADQAVINMREGIQRGLVQPKALVQAALPQYRRLHSADPSASVYLAPVRNFPAAFAQAERQSLDREYRDVIEQKLNPAMGRLAFFLEQEYLPAARDTSGWSALPDGPAWYQEKIKAETSVELTPDQIHATGLAEVARIQKEFEILGPNLGYSGPAAGLPVWVSQQGKFTPFTTEQEILDAFRAMNASVEDKLTTLFAVRPKARLDVRLIPDPARAASSDHYEPPAADGTRPGVFWAVVLDPKTYKNTGMASLMLHEGQPGHHFQQALQQEMEMPAYRRRFFLNSYVEGWALYAESLGRELGMYEQPGAYFGQLNAELTRASRLVVDTGIHARGWTREQAIAWLMETIGNDERTATSAVQRYMAWPTQALGYKIGEMKIMELRRRAEAALGAKFSLADFHAVVLGDGTLPLPLVEAKISRWIGQGPGGP